MMLHILFCMLVLGLIIVVLTNQKRKEQESFKVLGSLGPLKDLYYQCLNQCEKTDPAKQMSPSKGSMTCLAYCDSIITDLTRRGGPSYPLDLPIANVPVKTNIDYVYEKCGDGSFGARCRSLMATDYQIDDKCRQDCEYSTESVERCMEGCSQSRASNKTIGWSWK